MRCPFERYCHRPLGITVGAWHTRGCLYKSFVHLNTHVTVIYAPEDRLICTERFREQSHNMDKIFRGV